jgi:phosphoenolpyruvate---glycerone phosphotransferase subunit DhaL
MGKSDLSLAETRDMFLRVADGMIASKDILTEADRAVGDGDHGIGMARGFEAVREKLLNSIFTSVPEMVKAVGTTLMTSVGGAAGAVFGTLFREGAKGFQTGAVLDSQALSQLLVDGLRAVQARGGARPGDKTMVDALDPAAAKAVELSSLPLDQCLAAVAEAARQGMESTKKQVAVVGKAKTLGERSLGHADPGAVSTYLILKYMAEYASATELITQ